MRTTSKVLAAIFMATLIFCSTVLADSSYSGSGSSGLITGTLKVYTTSGYATATTVNKTSSSANAYVLVKLHYYDSDGDMYWSTAAENSGTSYTSATRKLSDDDLTVFGAKSAHGSSKNSISFNLP